MVRYFFAFGSALMGGGAGIPAVRYAPLAALCAALLIVSLTGTGVMAQMWNDEGQGYACTAFSSDGITGGWGQSPSQARAKELALQHCQREGGSGCFVNNCAGGGVGGQATQPIAVPAAPAPEPREKKTRYGSKPSWQYKPNSYGGVMKYNPPEKDDPKDHVPRVFKNIPARNYDSQRTQAPPTFGSIKGTTSLRPVTKPGQHGNSANANAKKKYQHPYTAGVTDGRSPNVTKYECEKGAQRLPTAKVIKVNPCAHPVQGQNKRIHVPQTKALHGGDISAKYTRNLIENCPSEYQRNGVCTAPKKKSQKSGAGGPIDLSIAR